MRICHFGGLQETVRFLFAKTEQTFEHKLYRILLWIITNTECLHNGVFKHYNEGESSCVPKQDF